MASDYRPLGHNVPNTSWMPKGSIIKAAAWKRINGTLPQWPYTRLLAWRALWMCLIGFLVFIYLDRRHLFGLSIEINNWRSWCQNQVSFDHALADSLAPTTVLVGVFTVDRAQSRRQAIRQTWARGLGPYTNSSVQVRFVIGQPSPKLHDSIQLEQEVYGDLVVLEIKENMNEGKTYAWFSHVAAELERTNLYQGRHFDYIAKADDDSFILARELERHLRVTSRSSTYWGFLMDPGFYMQGAGYAVSEDIVRWIGHSYRVTEHINGDEDQQFGKWISMYPNEVHFYNEACWIYDHPKSNRGIAHGFLFPSEYERIRNERGKSFTREEIRRRGGPRQLQTYSTVVRFDEWFWGYQLRPQFRWPGMTTRDKLNMLIEGETGRTPESWSERFLGLPYGGTVYVHQVKTDDAMFECALVLMEPSVSYQ